MDYGYYNMDCMEGMKQFPDKYFDIAITDPPYFSGPERRGYYGCLLYTSCGHTYANKSLKRYDNTDKATALEASSLTALLDYIGACYEEFPKDTDMIIHIVNPKRVRLITALDAERTRECLFEVNAEVNEFRFGHWRCV